MTTIYCQHCCQNHEYDEETCCYHNCGFECPVYQKEIESKHLTNSANYYHSIDFIPF